MKANPAKERMNFVMSALKKVWHFLWESDSVLSWIINIALAYVLIKFVLYPGLGFAFHTDFPIVAVVSGSMEHMKTTYDSNNPIKLCGREFEEKQYFVGFDEYWDICGSWYEGRGITKDQFSTFLFKDGFNKGDIMFIYGTNPKNLKIGDTIVFFSPAKTEPIIHRIIRIHETGEGASSKRSFTTKGDHNGESGSLDINIAQDKVLGKAVFRIPFLGWAKIWFVDGLNWIKSVAR